MTKEIAAIDRKINLVRKRLRSLEKIDLDSAASWQAAWDRHPDLQAQERELYRQRGIAQQERDQREYEAALHRASTERRAASALNRKTAAALRAAEAQFPVGTPTALALSIRLVAFTCGTARELWDGISTRSTSALESICRHLKSSRSDTLITTLKEDTMPFDGVKLNQTAQDLLAGKSLLLRLGWVPECGTERTGPHCVLTANYEATYDPENNSRRLAAFEVLKKAGGFRRGTELTVWNDAQTSVEPVLELFDRAIALAF